MAEAPITQTTATQARPPASLPVTSALEPARAEALRSVGAAFGRTRLRTLVSLRWMAIAGQALAVLFVHYMLGFELPLAACLAAVGASAWLNVALMAVFPFLIFATTLASSRVRHGSSSPLPTHLKQRVRSVRS